MAHWITEKDQEEGVEMLSEVEALLDRGELALIPIWGPAPGHWTLLVLERVDSGPAQPALHAAAPASAGTLRAKDPVKALQQLDRQQETAYFLDQPSRPVLPKGAGWRARYYDSLDDVHMSCWNNALCFLKNLASLRLGAHMPAPSKRENKSKQDGAECGFWILHFMEEEARRKRGEGKWTCRYNVVYRLELLKGMIAKLKPAQQRAKDKEKAELAKDKAKKAAKIISTGT